MHSKCNIQKYFLRINFQKKKTLTASSDVPIISIFSPSLWLISSVEVKKNCRFCSPQTPQLIGPVANSSNVSIVNLGTVTIQALFYQGKLFLSQKV